MGMFDYVTCEANLPGDQPKSRLFQTKDLACTMAAYTIKADGSLVGDDGPIAFHGMLCFYLSEASPDGGETWFEYEAKFTNGTLQGINVVEILHTPVRDVPT